LANSSTIDTEREKIILELPLKCYSGSVCCFAVTAALNGNSSDVLIDLEKRCGLVADSSPAKTWAAECFD
jgi:hypothetical protein